MFSLSKLLCVSLFLTLAAFVNALPAPDNIANDLARRASATAEAASPSATSVTTTSVVQTDSGPMTETCVLTFTPEGGQFQEVSNCSMSPAASGSSNSTASSATSAAGNVGAAPSATSTVTPNAVVAATFTVPGRQLLVLPVGLGVFGGISAITFIVVVLVTFERVRYRRAFRQRKLAETGAPMGYSGYGGNFKA